MTITPKEEALEDIANEKNAMFIIFGRFKNIFPHMKYSSKCSLSLDCIMGEYRDIVVKYRLLGLRIINKTIDFLVDSCELYIPEPIFFEFLYNKTIVEADK